VSTAGTIHVDKVFYKLDVDHALQQVLVVSDGNQAGDKIIVTDLLGEILAEHTRPAPGTTYVGNGRPRGRRPKTAEASPKS
jgi:putative transposase